MHHVWDVIAGPLICVVFAVIFVKILGVGKAEQQVKLGNPWPLVGVALFLLVAASRACGP